MNRFLTEAAADPSLAPAEFGLLGLTPAPWSVTDSLAIAMQQIRRFGQNGGNELDNARLLLDLLDHFPLADAKGIFTDLLWIEDPTAPTTISPAEQQVIRDPISPLNPTQVALVTAHQAAIRGTIMSMAEERTMVASLTKEIGWPYAFPAMGSGDLFSIDALFLRAVVGPSAVFPTSRDYFRNVVTNTNPGRNAVLVGALRTVITALTTQYGTTDPTQ